MYTFSAEAIQKIRHVVKQVLSEPQFRTPRETPSVSAWLQTYIGKTDGSGITARSGTTPGSGTVTLYKINSSGTLETWKDKADADITKTCYNLSSEAVGASAYVVMMQDLLSGKLLAVWEDC